MADSMQARLAEGLSADDVDVLVGLGCELSDAGDHINAARCFRRALDLGAEWVAFNLGNELTRLGRDGVAVTMYERALAAGEVDAWLNLGQVLERVGDLAGALRAFEQGEASGDVNAGLERAFLLREIDQRADAERVVEKLAAAGSALADAIAACWLFDRTLNPDLEDRLRAGAELFPSARAGLASLLWDTGRLAEAVSVLQRGVALGEVESFLPLANIYADDLDDPAAAEATYRAGIAAGDSHCHHNLAELLVSQERMAEALHHYRLAAAAGDQLAIRALGELRPGEQAEE